MQLFIPIVQFMVDLFRVVPFAPLLAFLYLFLPAFRALSAVYLRLAREKIVPGGR